MRSKKGLMEKGLIERAKKRDEVVVVKNSLKRVKSSTGLRGLMKK